MEYVLKLLVSRNMPNKFKNYKQIVNFYFLVAFWIKLHYDNDDGQMNNLCKTTYNNM